MKHTTAAVLLLTVPLVLGAADKNVWNSWRRELRHQCPGNHVDWISGDGYDVLLADFVETLPVATRKRIAQIADYSHRCSDVKIGFSCEMAVHLDALIQLGLLKQFAAFGCQHYKCSEPALCTRSGR
jgi:hypothetical protein